MENRTRVLLLSALLLGPCAGALAQQAPAAAPAGAAQGRVVEPQVERREVRTPKIDTSNIEVGAFFGALSIEDFGTNPVHGVRLAVHLTEDFFFEGTLGRSRGGATSFETLGGNPPLLTPAERRLTFYNLGFGYNLLPGEVYLGGRTAMNSALYLSAGIGGTKFAGDERFTVNFGAGYRVLPTDWLAIHVDVQNLVFQSDVLGKDKLTSNIGAWLGATVFF